jgi:hypothetical protein
MQRVKRKEINRVKKEDNKVFTYGQLEELRDSLVVPMDEVGSNKQDHILRKYYNICSLLDAFQLTKPLVDELKCQPIAARYFVFLLWNELVNSCINACDTLTVNDIENRDSKNLLSTKINAAQYIHVLNDMISVNDYTTIQDEALQFAIDTIKEKYNGERKEK